MQRAFNAVRKTLRHKRVLTRLVSLTLTFLLIFLATPTVIFAEISDAFSDSEGSLNTAADFSAGTEIVEDETKREERVKHFRLEDGSYVAAQYDLPIHTLSSDGKWVDIDNSLSASGSEYTNSSQRIKFSKKITGNGSLFTLHDGNTKLTLSLIGAKRGVAASIKNGADAEEETKLQKLMNLEKLSSAVIYPEILDGVDLEYVVNSLNVKENIIVKNKKDSYSYSFLLSLNNLTATLKENGDVAILGENGEQKYTIPAPVVFDSENNYAGMENATYTLLDNGNGKYTLTVSVSAEWMNEEGRAFPVTVDPAVTVAQSSFVDTYIDANNPNESYASSTEILVSNSCYGYWKTTSLPTLPIGSYITKATLSMTTTGVLGGFGKVSIHKAITSWNPTITWNSYSTSYQGMVEDLILDFDGTSGKRTWEITGLVKYWYEMYNDGVVLKFCDDIGSFVKFYSSDYYTIFDLSSRPAFSISYVDMRGLEDYWSYTSQSVGLAGSGSVNLATGQLTFAIPTLTTTDSLFGFTPTLVYDSYLFEAKYTNSTAPTPMLTSFLSNGFKLNLFETVMKYTGQTFYLHADADGTVHGYEATNANGVYYDTDGLQKVMSVLENGNIEITDDTKIIKRFTKIPDAQAPSGGEGWYLTEIEDVNENILRFTYDSQLKPIKVSVIPWSSSEIDMLHFYYYSTGILRMVYNHNSGNAVIFRYSSQPYGDIDNAYSNCLRQAHFVICSDSVTLGELEAYASNVTPTEKIKCYGISYYDYNLNGFLSKVKDGMSQESVSYDWDGYKPNYERVRQVVHRGKNNEQGQSISITYGENYSDVRASGNDEISGNDDDIITRYVFDEYGRTVSTYSRSASSPVIYGATVGEYETQENVKNNIKESTVLGGSPVSFLLNGDFSSYKSNKQVNYWTLTGTAYRNAINDYLTISLGANQSGYFYQDVTLPAGKYTLSFIYYGSKADGIAATASAVSLTGGSLSHSETIGLNDEYFPTENTTFTTTFTVPTGGDTVRITVSATADATQSVTSYLYVTNVTLGNGIGASDYSLLSYGSFDGGVIQEGSTVPLSTFWTTEAGSAPQIIAEDGGFLNVAKVTAEFGEERFVKQRIFSSPNGTGYFPSKVTVSGYARAYDAIRSVRGKFRIRVDISYYQSNGAADLVKSFYIDFLSTVDGWQFAADTITTKYGTVRIYDSNGNQTGIEYYNKISAVDIILEYSNQPAGYALFDNISVTKAVGGDVVSYEYYSNGLLAKKSNIFYEEFYEYDSQRRLTRVSNNWGEIIDYTYIFGKVNTETKYDFVCTGTTSKEYPHPGVLPGEAGYFNPDELITKTPVIRTIYTYNEYGLCTCISTYIPDENLNQASGTKRVISGYWYELTPGSPIFGALTSESDTSGTDFIYFYDNKDGKLLAQVNDDSGNGISYGYDEFDRLIYALPCYYSVFGIKTDETDAESVSYSYDAANRLSKITTESTEYSLSYDAFGNQSEIKIGSGTIASYEYGTNNGKLKKVNYANGFSEEYVYGELENLAEIWYNYPDGTRELAYSYDYTGKGQLYKLTDHRSGEYTVYTYDINGRIKTVLKYGEDSNKRELSQDYYYDDRGRLTQLVYLIQDGTANTYDSHRMYNQFTYDTEGRITKTRIYGVATDGSVNYVYDDFGRLVSRSNGHTTEVGSKTFSNSVGYQYKETAEDTTARLETYTSTVGGVTTTVSYMYNNDGYILREDYTVGSNATLYTYYTYDNLGQLVREDNGKLNRTFLYTYDDAGNLLTKREYALVDIVSTPTELISEKVYTYGNAQWGDQLTAVNGTAITYDGVGNPLSYYNGATFAWTGRQLTGATKDGNVYSFTYNDAGIRTSKTKNGTKTTYHLDGSLIIAEETGSDLIVYVYDDTGSPLGFQYRNATYAADVWYTYWYEKNPQGDIIAVYDAEGTKLVSYKYDAWGNFTVGYHNGGASDFAKRNPFRYRGYYYDADLDLYYLNTRYYDYNIGRFINTDAIHNLGINGDLISYNLYVYCSNNPVNYIDPTGQWTISQGVNVFGLIIGGISYSLDLVIDDNANVAIQITEANVLKKQAGAVIGGINLGISRGYNISNADTVYDLEGISTSVSASVSLFGVSAFSSDIGDIPNSIYGAGLSVGPSIANVDIHATTGKTTTLASFNIADTVQKIWKEICSWFS